MEVKDLSQTEKYRLSKIRVCSICNCPIEDYHDLQVIKYRSGRRVEYNFFHTECLKNARQEIRRV